MSKTIEERVDALLQHGVDKPKKWAQIHGYSDPTIDLERHPIEPGGYDSAWENRKCPRCGRLVGSVRSSEFGIEEPGQWLIGPKRGPVGKCHVDLPEDWRAEWQRLRDHHLQETNFLFDVIRELAKRVRDGAA